MSDEQPTHDQDRDDDVRGRRQSWPPADRQQPAAPRDRQARPEVNR
ncbi:hypothetical protein O7630_34515 [Micromonospora sp. WMMD718]|nr:hypothetical protein [Micromonospora sp. WMMD718]MDG4756060.1 hypothetical protein [Micromonospora sp. WMMD718]